MFIRQHQALTTTCVPYIEGPKMNWTIDDGLYNRFLKWNKKCENILDCELDMLSDAWKCKKVVAWSGDFGIAQVHIMGFYHQKKQLWKSFGKKLKSSVNHRQMR